MSFEYAWTSATAMQPSNNHILYLNHSRWNAVRTLDLISCVSHKDKWDTRWIMEGVKCAKEEKIWRDVTCKWKRRETDRKTKQSKGGVREKEREREGCCTSPLANWERENGVRGAEKKRERERVKEGRKVGATNRDRKRERESLLVLAVEDAALLSSPAWDSWGPREADAQMI